MLKQFRNWRKKNVLTSSGCMFSFFFLFIFSFLVCVGTFLAIFVSLGSHFNVILQPKVASQMKKDESGDRVEECRKQCHLEFQIGDPENRNEARSLINITQTLFLGFFVHNGRLSF